MERFNFCVIQYKVRESVLVEPEWYETRNFGSNCRTQQLHDELQRAKKENKKLFTFTNDYQKPNKNLKRKMKEQG